MFNKKACALGILIALAPCTTQTSFYENLIPHCFLNISTEIPLNKKTLLIGGAVAGSALLGYWLYNYFFVLTLEKAEKLCHEVTEHINYAGNEYEREITLLESNKELETQKKELQDIIAQLDSESPYLTYTNKIKADLDKCEKYEKRFYKGVPQLQKAMNKIINKTSKETYNHTQNEIGRYENVLTSIAQLREILHFYRLKLKKLVSYCVQFDAYKQEKILEQLQNIQTQLIMNNLNTSHSMHHYHHSTLRTY